MKYQISRDEVIVLLARRPVEEVANNKVRKHRAVETICELSLPV